MPDKKNVALKLKDRLCELNNKILNSHDNTTRLRLGVVANDNDGLTGLTALKAIFERQVAAQLRVHKIDKKATDVLKPDSLVSWNDTWMQYITMWFDSMIDEIQEARGWLNWKSWKKPKKITQEDIVNARLELVDLFHFWINAYVMLGGDEKSLIAEYHAKRDENDDRQRVGY